MFTQHYLAADLLALYLTITLFTQDLFLRFVISLIYLIVSTLFLIKNRRFFLTRLSEEEDGTKVEKEKKEMKMRK